MNLPEHVAIIMDGNGRWAKGKGLPRVAGHRKGLQIAEKIIDRSLEIGIKYLSLFVFSTENWKRSESEVRSLFDLAKKYLGHFEKFCKDRARIVVSGDIDGLPEDLRGKITDIQSKTREFDSICVNLCINYGGQREIADAVKKLVESGGEISVENIKENLYQPFLPEPDLIVRTGGCKRLSNFLLFQSAYSELIFSDTFWPDFSCEEYDAILREYESRTRNFGGIKDA